VYHVRNSVNDFNESVNRFCRNSVTFDCRMKQFRSILSVLFAFLVLFSSSNIMVGLHLCSGQIQNIALFSKAESCEMEKRMPPCHRHESQSCCDDETIVHNGEDFNAPATAVSMGPVFALDIELPPVPISEVIPCSPVSNSRLYNYDPPVRAADLTVSLHVFLI
jgi:hypothetical protein